MKIQSLPPVGDFVSQVGRKVLDSDFGSDLPQGDRDALVLATTGGAVVGAVIGTSIGFQAQGGNRVDEVWLNHGIDHPRLAGYSHSANADYSQQCHSEGSGEHRHEVCTTKLDGWWHRYSPNIHHDQVGAFTAPEFNNTHWAEPLLGGFLGAMGGGLLGLGLGVGINVLRHSMNQPGNQPASDMSEARRSQLANTAGWMAVGGATLGVVGGGILGHVAGIIEQSQKEIHTRDWMGPVLQRTRLGEIPADHYEYNLGLGFPGSGLGFGHGSTQSVYRDVPLYNGDGTPQLQSVRHTFDTARYGGLGGAIWGGLIGGGVGLAAGIAGSTLLKMVESQPQDKPAK